MRQPSSALSQIESELATQVPCELDENDTAHGSSLHGKCPRSAVTTPPAAATLLPPVATPPRRQWQLNDNVLAPFNNNYYLAHVTHVHEDGTYTVYFPEDGDVENRIPGSRLRPSDGRSMRREAMIGKDWYFSGDKDVAKGQWEVKKINGNVYACSRLTGRGPVVSEEFDIGFVIGCYRDGVERKRERGPML